MKSIIKIYFMNIKITASVWLFRLNVKSHLIVHCVHLNMYYLKYVCNTIRVYIYTFCCLVLEMTKSNLLRTIVSIIMWSNVISHVSYRFSLLNRQCRNCFPRKYLSTYFRCLKSNGRLFDMLYYQTTFNNQSWVL